MKINIYYGGRGLIEDSTIYVMNRITDVLDELRVDVKRYNLYEKKNELAMLPNTLKEADGIILAVNVEWLGMGGYMHMFLDSCWLYADKEKIKKIFMLPVAVTNTYGEKEQIDELSKAWELLGGLACEGLSAYVDDRMEFETNPKYRDFIENKAENFYRIINKKMIYLPSSNHIVRQKMSNMAPIDLTPQESEQLSMYVSDDSYVKKQKEDIEHLTQLFKDKLMSSESGELKQEFIKEFREHFKPQPESYIASIAINMTDINKCLILEVKGKNLKCYYGSNERVDVSASTTKEIINNLINGRTTFQGAFMSGSMKAKGDFKTLRSFDQIFQF